MGKKVRITLDLIRRRVTEGISSAEEVVFQLWVIQSKDHEKFYEQTEKYFKNSSSYTPTPSRTDQEWKRLEIRMDQLDRRKTLVLRYGSVAFIAASVLIIFLITIFQNKTTTEVADNALTPGSEKATLILDNGKEIELSKNEEINIGKKQHIIVIDNTLKYDEATTKKLTFNTLKVDRGETFSLSLSDGTKVYLNSQTALRYPIAFNGNVRSVEILEGEAFFDVVEDISKPFQISINNQIIEVLGTSFNVSAYRDEDYIQTTLVEGKVKVYEATNPESSQIILPNEQLTFDIQTGLYVKKKVNPINYTSWVDGIYYFEDTELQEIMKILSRWYNYEVFFSDTSLAETRYGGKIQRMESLNSLISMIERTNDIQFVIENNTIEIKPLKK
ncbi:MAG: DUF4974 domain-containing protein [Cytophagales bacterium]|nr:DUF4974 domain-containing protein [Cytophagales bacterium]